MTNEQKIERISDLYEHAYNETESFCEGSDLVGQTLYLIGAIAHDGMVELTKGDPFLHTLHALFQAKDPIWKCVEVTK